MHRRWNKFHLYWHRVQITLLFPFASATFLMMAFKQLSMDRYETKKKTQEELHLRASHRRMRNSGWTTGMLWLKVCPHHLFADFVNRLMFQAISIKAFINLLTAKMLCWCDPSHDHTRYSHVCDDMHLRRRIDDSKIQTINTWFLLLRSISAYISFCHSLKSHSTS